MLPSIRLALAIALLVIAMPVAARNVDDQSACQWNRQCLKLGGPELARIRGGFSVDTPAGRLEIAIGITRVIAINEQLVAVSHLVLPDAAHIAAAARAQAEAAVAASGVAAAQTASSGGAQQNTPAKADAQAVANAVASAGAGGAQAAPAGGTGVQAPTGATNAVPAASASVGSPGTTGGQPVLTLPKLAVNGVPVVPGTHVTIGQNQAILVQNGPDNVANMPAESTGFTLPTVIQNTLNGQRISSATLINITSNSLSALRRMTFGDVLRSATVQSAR